MTARLEYRLTKEESITELFIDSEDGSTNICILRFKSATKYSSYETTELQLGLNELVKAINHGVIDVVHESRLS
jgi:hypothetical protein